MRTMMLRRWLWLILIVLYWIPSTQCLPWRLVVYDAYIEQEPILDAAGQPTFDADGNQLWMPIQSTPGYHLLMPWQSEIEIGGMKPDEPGCAISYSFPVAVDIDGEVMRPECQPVPLMVDGQSWEGM